MAAQSSIPLSFQTDDPKVLKRELERLASALAAYFGQLTGQSHAQVVEPRLRTLPLNSPKAAFGFVTPVALPNAADSLDISLPPPNPQNEGLKAHVVRKTVTGTIRLSAPGCLVNDQTVATIASPVGWYPVLFQGGNYYTQAGAT